MREVRRVGVVDSHTGGEPTRLVVSGPDLGSGSMAERLTSFREKHDLFRSAVVNEPRGSDVVVGALLCRPSDRTCAAGVIFLITLDIWECVATERRCSRARNSQTVRPCLRSELGSAWPARMSPPEKKVATRTLL